MTDRLTLTLLHNWQLTSKHFRFDDDLYLILSVSEKIFDIYTTLHELKLRTIFTNHNLFFDTSDLTQFW